jgi:predicted HTH transcriptional regulator
MAYRKHPLLQRIDEGENSRLDFKFEVSDAPKIARSLVAFANTNGGSLLIGVKDNGKIAGVRSEEEFFMIQNAATRYCIPEVRFRTKEWLVQGKKVLEVMIPKGKRPPYKARDIHGKAKAYLRIADENILAGGVQMKIWKNLKYPRVQKFTNSPDEKAILALFTQHNTLSLKAIKQHIPLPGYKTETLLAGFVLLGLISLQATTEDEFFTLENITDS